MPVPPRVPNPATGLVHTTVQAPAFEPGQDVVYARALRALREAGLEVVVGGALALNYYTGLWRFPKDLDLFLRRADLPQALAALAEEGFQVQQVDPAWIATATLEGFRVDLLHGNANGMAAVDEGFFEEAPPWRLLGEDVRIVPLEDFLLSKMFVGTRDRWDAADVLHALFAARDRARWGRVLDRAGEHWGLLLAYLVLFLYVYPGHADALPRPVLDELLARLRRALDRGPGREAEPFRGRLLDPVSFRVDVREWGLEEAPPGPGDAGPPGATSRSDRGPGP